MTAPIDATDEVFHTGDDPHFNESAWFSFALPERDMNGFFYFWHNSASGTSGGGPALWDPTGEQTYDCRFYDWRWLQPPTGPLDFAGFRLPNSAGHEMVEPLERYRLTYDELGFQLDLEWTALMAPHEMNYGTTTLASARHFDQAGHVTGSLVLDGEQLAVDCFSLRDHTWGPHRAGAARSGDYLWAIASQDAHWQLIAVAGDEPGVDRVMNGYLVRDGEQGELVSGTRRVVERRGGAPVKVILDAEDDRGRALHAEGDVRTALRWFGWPGRMTFWTLTDWHWDDQQGWGEDQEFWPLPQVRELMRNA